MNFYKIINIATIFACFLAIILMAYDIYTGKQDIALKVLFASCFGICVSRIFIGIARLTEESEDDGHKD